MYQLAKGTHGLPVRRKVKPLTNVKPTETVNKSVDEAILGGRRLLSGVICFRPMLVLFIFGERKKSLSWKMTTSY